MSAYHFGDFVSIDAKRNAKFKDGMSGGYNLCSINYGDIEAVAVSLCKFNSRRNPRSPENRFYESLVGMILDDSGNCYRAYDGYLEAEPSIKSSLSFYAGMIAARIVGENHMGMASDFIFHAKDCCIKLEDAPGKKGFIPDFVGFDKGFHNAYLLEAKGSADNVKPKTLEHAKEQLSNIDRVELINAPRNPAAFSGQRIGRYIVTSEFHKTAGNASPDGEWYISRIDPPSEGADILVCELHIALASYYENIVRAFDLFERVDREPGCLPGDEAVAIRFGVTTIGLSRCVYEKMSEFYKEFYDSKECSELAKGGATPWAAMLEKVRLAAKESSGEEIKSGPDGPYLGTRFRNAIGEQLKEMFPKTYEATDRLVTKFLSGENESASEADGKGFRVRPDGLIVYYDK